MADASRFPWWAAIAAGAGLVLLLVGAFLSFGADTTENGEDYGSDPDDFRNVQTMRNVAGLFGDLGGFAIAGAFFAAAAFGANPGYTRAIFAVVHKIYAVPAGFERPADPRAGCRVSAG